MDKGKERAPASGESLVEFESNFVARRYLAFKLKREIHYLPRATLQAITSPFLTSPSGFRLSVLPFRLGFRLQHGHAFRLWKQKTIINFLLVLMHSFR